MIGSITRQDYETRLRVAHEACDMMRAERGAALVRAEIAEGRAREMVDMLRAIALSNGRITVGMLRSIHEILARAALTSPSPSKGEAAK